MNGNATTRHSNVALLSVTSTMADRVTTSESIDEKLLPVLKRLKLPTGLLQRVAGVYERRAEVPGLRMTYEPAELRFFQARFEPREPFLAGLAPAAPVAAAAR